MTIDPTTGFSILNLAIPLGVGDSRRAPGTFPIISGFVTGSRTLLSEEGEFRSDEGGVSLVGAVGQKTPTVGGGGELKEVVTLSCHLPLSSGWLGEQDRMDMSSL